MTLYNFTVKNEAFFETWFEEFGKYFGVDKDTLKAAYIAGCEPISTPQKVDVDSLLCDEFKEGSAYWNMCVRHLKSRGYLNGLPNQ